MYCIFQSMDICMTSESGGGVVFLKECILCRRHGSDKLWSKSKAGDASSWQPNRRVRLSWVGGAFVGQIVENLRSAAVAADIFHLQPAWRYGTQRSRRAACANGHGQGKRLFTACLTHLVQDYQRTCSRLLLWKDI